MSNPQVTSLQTLRPALVAAQKYEILSAIDGLRAALVTQTFLKTDPLGVYAIACELGLKEEAKIGMKINIFYTTQSFNSFLLSEPWNLGF
jgi:hypothetical protein